jgi:hypothetical protein
MGTEVRLGDDVDRSVGINSHIHAGMKRGMIHPGVPRQSFRVQ